MRVVIMGAGGWGALVGAYLYKAGAEVSLVFRRQAHVDEIQKNGGLIIECADGVTTVPVHATVRPEELHDTGLLIVAVKNHDTEAALQSVQHINTRAIATVQNGLGRSEPLKKYFPKAQILRIVSRISGSLLDFGRVQRGERDFPTWIGDADHGITPFVEDVVHWFNISGLPCEASAEIEDVEWCKLMWWTPLSITATLSGLTTTEMLQTPDFAYLMTMITRDMAKVARSMGVQVRDYRTIEIMGWVEGGVEEAVRNVILHGKEWEEHGGKGYRQAMLLDIIRKRKTEIEDTGGYIWRMAQEQGIDVPYLDFGYRVIRGLQERFT